MSTWSQTVGELLDLGRYNCPLCEDRFESVGAKKRHIRDHHPKEKR